MTLRIRRPRKRLFSRSNSIRERIGPNCWWTAWSWTSPNLAHGCWMKLIFMLCTTTCQLAARWIVVRSLFEFVVFHFKPLFCTYHSLFGQVGGWALVRFLADNRGEVMDGWCVWLLFFFFFALIRHSRWQMSVHLITIQDWLKIITNVKFQKRKINYLASCPCYNTPIEAFCSTSVWTKNAKSPDEYCIVDSYRSVPRI